MNIMVLVNKDFEYAGYQAGISQQILDKKIPDLKVIAKDTGTGPSKFVPSCVYKLGNHKVREFCISYLFKSGESTSNSEVKQMLLQNLIKDENPDYIISVSTTETTTKCQGGDSDTHTKNGCVFMGCNFFAKDCREFDPTTESHLNFKEPWFRANGPLISDFYNFIPANQGFLKDGMMPVPNYPAPDLTVYSEDDYVSLGVINVMHYDCYPKADAATYSDFLSSSYGGYPVGLETTHAMVKMAAEATNQAPVLFVSPIVDRYEKFNDDVGKSWDEQNFISSYNSAIVVSNMLQLIKDKL